MAQNRQFLQLWINTPEASILHPMYLRPFLDALETRTLFRIAMRGNEDSSVDDYFWTRGRLLFRIETFESAQAVLDRAGRWTILQFLDNVLGDIVEARESQTSAYRAVIEVCLSHGQRWDYGWQSLPLAD